MSAQLAAQRKLGQLEAIDAGVIAVARILADLVDDEIGDETGSRYTAGMLAGRLQVALERLRGDRYVGADAEGVDAELAQLVAALRDTPRPDTSDAG